MYPSVRVPRARVVASILVLTGTLLVGTCTDGTAPEGPRGESQLTLTLAKGLLPDLAPDQVRPIERIRLTAQEVPGGTVLGSTSFTVDSGASQWTLDFSILLAEATTVSVTLSVELISLGTGSQLVEWSGRTGSLTLQVGQPTEVSDIDLVKGPLANLSVTGLSFDLPDLVLREASEAEVSVTVNTSMPQTPPTIFWRSLNPGVATVSGEGLVRSVVPGQARIVATAGAFADTLDVRVLARPASVLLTPAEVLLDALDEEVTFGAVVLDPRGDPVGEQEVTWTSADPAVLQHLGGGIFRSRGRGTTVVTAVSSLDPSVSGSATVTVRQVVAAVDVTPEEVVVLIGGPASFEAVALDANGNPIEGMDFFWSTPNPELATVDESGQAVGIAFGTATILAEAASSALGISTTVPAAPTPGTVGSATLVVLPEVDRVVVSPNPFTFRSVGETRQFTAQAVDEFGNPLPLTDFTWGSANEGVVTVDETGLAVSVGNGSTVLEATVRGVTGIAAVFVTQRVESIEITPGSWTFLCPEGCGPRTFTGRAYDAMGTRISGVEFSWSSDESCFDVTSPPSGTRATSAVVNDVCGCDTSPGELTAEASGVSGTAVLQPPSCGLAALLSGAPTCSLPQPPEIR